MEEQRETLHNILHSFRKVTSLLYHLLREESGRHDTTVVQLLVLRVLSKKSPLGLSELSDELILSNSTMSGVVDRLVASGLVYRDRSKGDRRSLVVRLTDKGKQKQREAFGDQSFLMTKLSKVLEIPKEDLQHLLNTHSQIVEKIQEHGGEKII